jgi:TolB-like protein/DNA-binding SARP family transcriptional activator
MVLGNHGHQRRRLALLAVLAAAGEVGRSRDQLLLLFWPDATQARARHSLEQLLYAIRSSIDEEAFAGVNPVSLNAKVIASDLGDFQAALERGELEDAVNAYGGPFLDGFYLSDSPEFEQWADAERRRIQRSFSGALESLATSADSARDHIAAVRWWRRLTETDPVSSRSAEGLIRALMNTGDYAAALQYAEQYERVVRQELGTSVGPAVTSLVAEARRIAELRPPAVSKSKRPAHEPAAPTTAPLPPIAAATDVPRVDAQQLDERAAIEVVNPREKTPPTARRRALYATAAAIVLSIIGVGAWLRPKPAEKVAPIASERSIAVLPFLNVNGDRENAALVDGLSEEMIAVLAKIPNLRVTSRTSAFAFRNSRASLRSIGDSLGVANILEAAVQRSGSQLRVHVRLVDAKEGSTRWSETYDRELKDIFVVQSEIAGAVARALDLHLGQNTRGRIARGSTTNIAAYELFLRGNDPTLTRSDSAAGAGLEYFRQAIRLDPNYAAAYAGYGRLRLRSRFDGNREIPLRDRMILAEQAARKAIALDPTLGEPHAVLSFIRRRNYDHAAAESEMKRAIELDPGNAHFREWLVQLYVALNRPREALIEGERAVRLDPLSATANAELARALMLNDRCDEALARVEQLRSLTPPLLRAGGIAVDCYARKKMWTEAIAEAERNAANSGSRGQARLGYLLARAGRNEEARRILSSLLARSKQVGGGAFEVAIVYAGLDEKDKAFEWLDKSVEDRSLEVEGLQTIADDLKSDARFTRIRRRVGLQ